MFDASLIYYATPLTTLKLNAATTVSESIIAGVSGALSTRLRISDRSCTFRRWLIGTVKLGYGTDNYEGSTRDDKRYIVSGGLIYKSHARYASPRGISTRMVDVDFPEPGLCREYLHVGLAADAMMRLTLPVGVGLGTHPSNCFSSSRNSGARSFRFSA